MKSGDFKAREFDGTTAGLASAIAYCGANGTISLYPGNASISIPTLPSGVALIAHEAAGMKFYGQSYGEFTLAGKRRNAYNVTDYVDVAAAIAAVPAGGSLYFPQACGPYIPPSNAGWTLSKAIEIYSDGEHPINGDLDQCFRFAGGATDGHKDSTIFTIAAGIDRVYLHDFFIYGSGTTPSTLGTGCGIAIDNTSGVTQYTRIERIRCENAGLSALRTLGTSPVPFLTINDFIAYASKGHGIHLEEASMLTMRGCSGNSNKLRGVSLKNCGNGVIHCDAAANGVDMASTTLDGQMVLDTCADLSVQGCNIEEFQGLTVENGLVLTASRGCVIGGNEFDCSTASAATRSIYLRGTSYGNTVLSNNHSQVEIAVEIATTADIGNIILPQAIQLASATVPGKVILPADSRNFAFLNDQPSGIADTKGLGIVLPKAGTTPHSSVLQNQLLWTDGTNVFIRLGGVTKTFTIT
jgi:hypothetical protein